MAGTVVLDDVELREAQRDYLDFLDDEVRKARGRESLLLGAPGDADGPRLAMADAAPRRAVAGPPELPRGLLGLRTVAAGPAPSGPFHARSSNVSPDGIRR